MRSGIANAENFVSVLSLRPSFAIFAANQQNMTAMKRTILFPLLLLLGLSGLRGQEVEETTDSLAVYFDLLVQDLLPAGTNVGICMYDLTAGRPLYEYQADKLSRPASTMKLLTTITSLAQPRADEPFRTEVWYQGTVKSDTLHGDLYVVGGFDPEFDEDALDSLVRSVARLPFSVIRGTVYGDVSMKDSLYWGSGWLWDDNPASFQPYLSPLMLCKGVVTVCTHPAERGMQALVKCRPESSYYRVQNNTRSRTPSAGRYRVTRNWMENGNEICVTGNVTSRTTNTLNLYSSQDFFMHTFVERLQQHGLRCAPTSWQGDTIPLLPPSQVYAFREFVRDSLSTRVARYETSAQRVVNEIMKESDNLNAEALLCRLGAQFTGEKRVSARDGLSAVRRLIEQLGFDPKNYRLADGCGLSHYDYISPELLVAFLKYAYSNTDVFQRLYKALPISGVDGTLKRRMGYGTPAFRKVHAKTGTYTGISSLAGYLQTADGHWVAFAIMNQNVLSGRQARAFQDALCTELIQMQVGK